MATRKKSEFGLEGKVAIVTGAGTGIGEAAAHKLASLGARVLCAGLPGDPVDEVAQAIKRRRGKADFFEGDLSDPFQARACVAHAVNTFGRLDILVSNAGVTLCADAAETIGDDEFLRTMHANVFTTFFIMREALPALKKTHGCIVATGSVAGLKGQPGDVVYGGTKGFVNAFVQGLAVEQAVHGIRVNAVLPGVTDTALTHAGRSAITKNEEKTMTEDIPMQRRGTVEEIANAIAFLASDLASYITGALLAVDGGYAVSWGGVDEVPARLKRQPKGELEGVLKFTRHGGFKKNNPDPRAERGRH